MAAFSTNTAPRHRRTGPSFFERLDALFTAIAKARTCVRDIEVLSALSDKQLAERGLTRETLVRHAARGYL